MCDKNTQILSQIDFEAQVNDEPEDEKTWARLYPIGSVFQKIGKYLSIFVIDWKEELGLYFKAS